MRSLVVDKFNNAEMVVFNRFEKSYDPNEFHKVVRGVSRRAEIVYEYTDGKVAYDDIEDPLPFDILVPQIGFYGIVVSYYASNIFGNCMRFVKVTKAAKARRALCGTLILPVILAFLTMWTSETIIGLMELDLGKLAVMLFFGLIWGTAYFGIFCALGKVKLFSKCGEDLFVKNTQQTIERIL